MQFIKHITVLTVFLFLGIEFALAESRLDERQANQQARIVQGVESGELTKRETRRLVNGQKKLQRMEKRAKADGVVTMAEKQRLRRVADRQSARIYVNKHDEQDR